MSGRRGAARVAVSLSQQTWVAIVSAVCFVILALLLAILPVPYVVYGPGRAYDVLGIGPDGRPVMQVQGVPTYPTSGTLDMTTVSVTRPDSSTSLLEALLAYWLPKRDALPRDSVYDKGKSYDQVRSEERQMMDTSQQDAVVAALRAVGQPVEELPVIASLTTSGPANGRLRPGDLVVAVDNVPVHTTEDIRQAVAKHQPGDTITFTVWRDRRNQRVEVTSTAIPSSQAKQDEAPTPVIGATISTGYRYAPVVNFTVSQEIGGPSAGLVFAVALYDQLTPGELLQGRTIAGTGTIDAQGRVGAIGGIQEKIAGAEQSGADVFLVPGDNCRDLAGLDTDVTLIKVDTLQDAIDGLRASGSPETAAQVPHC